MTGIWRSTAGEQAVKEQYRAILGHWPVPAEQRIVATGFGDTFVLVSGPAEAPPVVLLHGSAGNAVTWMGDIAALAQRFRVYVVDMIGEPGLSAPTRPGLESGALAAWLAEVWDALGLEKAALVGMSLGGLVSLQFATRYPERLERLGLLCPSGIGRQLIGKVLLALLVRPFGKGGRRKAAELILGAVIEAPDGPARVIADFFALVNKNFKPRMGKMPPLTDAELRRLAMPVLAIVGGRDAMLDSAETKRRLEANAPHAKVLLLPERGHLLIGLTQQIEEFLTAGRAHA
ncbi:alpha/beta fold hydrolase [Fodinicola acaciae]|uniref:alpha/beta fold hydrolase n=1 Tax=Fodinicola acaciae TaxID=2681555 RepID=UPI0013D1ADCF|nr:alpha/beta fold hydrolase [Fodinicola acaciae]